MNRNRITRPALVSGPFRIGVTAGFVLAVILWLALPEAGPILLVIAAVLGVMVGLGFLVWWLAHR